MYTYLYICLAKKLILLPFKKLISFFFNDRLEVFISPVVLKLKLYFSNSNNILVKMMLFFLKILIAILRTGSEEPTTIASLLNYLNLSNNYQIKTKIYLFQDVVEPPVLHIVEDAPYKKRRKYACDQCENSIKNQCMKE